MGSPAELTLGRPSSIIKSVPLSRDQLDRMRRLEQYTKALEDERKKIEAFKRELPFCMQLLSDAIETTKEQLADCQQPSLKRQVTESPIFEEDSNLNHSNGKPVLEEFIPLKHRADESTFEDFAEEREIKVCDEQNGGKSNRFLQARSRNKAEAFAHGREVVSSFLPRREKTYKNREFLCFGQEQSCNGVTKPVLQSQRRAGGAFLPFCRDRLSTAKAGSAELPDLSLPFGDGEVSPGKGPGEMFLLGGANHQSKETPNATVCNASGQACSPPQRKARRCWSPELHRRFVNALQQLGGSEVATPKQIRELMKVDGLTNDEVKSHLQKYRLHTRRPNPGFQSTASHAPQLVVLGGIWVPPEYAAHAAAAAQQGPPPIYSPSQQAPHLPQAPFSREHYTQLNTTPQLQLHPSLYYNEQQAAATHSQGSSQGPLQLTGHSSDAAREESIEEDGNEGSSWKAEYQEERFHEVEENGDSYEGKLRVHKWRYSRDSGGEDDSEAEDSRVYETAM